ncbi:MULTISPECIES: APC family permease [unclassified Mycolicibacterium]|uniref:APC family permease n=1 Tax=unclassified Mycolicibacterium TaxID=2636767 RepID=UPI0012DBDA75|nr:MULTISPECIES: APC family permease [unclassified Mycolicibacterium]MUL82540.1 APC family permease [Mycolicibacterium sp. CBMA 329]MUL91328.1 APC family permease [Mycolicibacterium sp. CBMA 331]MUM01451.1 APC family permease [Mycolicibacterium sp. CBMA 334]MUM29648.1 APC family permease [Mycolicibacterium sp. CBMA 295]MUM41752.1 APC family permease [Mycolicibacterium sp. CBMA 247]
MTEEITTEATLRRDAIDWKQVGILSVAGCGPASVIALNLQFMGQFAGSALVLAFLLVWPGILLLVNTFAEFSKRLPTSGGLYTWNSKAWGPSVGFVYGWMFIGAYMVFSAAGFAVFGGWVQQWLGTQFGVQLPWWIFTVAALAYVCVLAYLGISQSLHAALGLLGFEMVVLLALALWIFVTGPQSGSGFGTAPFEASSAGAMGWGAVGLAMTYAVLSHVGIEEGATLGMEVRDPKRHIPRGLWAAAIVVPVFYVLIAYAMVYGYGIDRMTEFGEDPAPLQTIAETYWGKLGLTVVVLATLSSILAFSQTAFIAGARVLYTLGRERVLPQRLGEVSSRQTPAVAIAVMGVISMALGVPLAFLVGPFNVWGYFGFLISIAFLVSYIVTNFGLIRYMLRIGEFHWFRHGVLGLIGSLVFLYPLYKTVWPLQSGIYGALPFVYLAWIALGVGLLVHTLRRRPEVMDRIGSSLAESDHP